MSTPTYKNLSALIEQPESGRIENQRNYSQTITKVYTATYAVCVAALKVSGTLGSGSLLGYTVQSSTVDRSRGDIGKLTDVWGAGGADADPGTTPLPPDEVSVTGTNQSPRTERHPYFNSLTSGELKLVETALRAQDSTERDTAYDDLAGGTGQDLVDLIRAGNESYYLATLRYSWATHSYTVPTSTAGGYIDTPGGPLASYFTGVGAWLRESDDLQYSNGVWRITKTWLAADAWNSLLY